MAARSPDFCRNPDTGNSEQQENRKLTKKPLNLTIEFREKYADFQFAKVGEVWKT